MFYKFKFSFFLCVLFDFTFSFFVIVYFFPCHGLFFQTHRNQPVMHNIEEILKAIWIGLVVALFLLKTGRGLQATELCNECLILLNNLALGIEDQFSKSFYRDINEIIFNAYYAIYGYTHAKRYTRKLLAMFHDAGIVTIKLGNVYQRQSRFVEAKEFYESAINIMKTISDQREESVANANLGNVCYSLGEYGKAKEYLEKALAMTKEIGDRNGEARAYGNLGSVFDSLGEYGKAKEYLEKALAMTKEIGDINGEATAYGNLGSVFYSLGEYRKAKEYLEKALAMTKKIGDRNGEATAYRSLGSVFNSLGEYGKAKEYHEKALSMTKEIGDKNGEATDYGNLGSVFYSLGEYRKAKEYHEKALAVRIKIGDRKGESRTYGKLGNVFYSLAEYRKAKEYHKKALAITKEIGDINEESTAYGNLGTVFRSLGEYQKAKEYLEKALAMTKEIGDRNGEATAYGNLGNVFYSLGEYQNGKECQEKALAITKAIGDRTGEAMAYGNLGSVFYALGDYRRAKEYLEKAFAMTKEIGDREGEGANLGDLGNVFHSLGDYQTAKEYHEKSLAISIEIGDRRREAEAYGNLGYVFRSLGEYDVAEEYIEKARLISSDIGDNMTTFTSLVCIAQLKVSQSKFQEAISYLFQCIEKYEELQNFVKGNDQFQISLLENRGTFSYKLFSSLLCATENARDALYVEELGRARGLSEFMADKFSVENHISANPKSWFGIENIVNKESNCTCLYISYNERDVLLWVLRSNGDHYFRKTRVDEVTLRAELVVNVDGIFKKSALCFGILPKENCEDRSLDDNVPISLDDESRKPLRGNDTKDTKQTLHLCYEMIIAPVVGLLTEPEIIIVPESCSYRVPFAALRDQPAGKYLSETYRIRIVPSLTTLGLIQDCPKDYHSQTGALVVGDPKVGEVLYMGRPTNITPLPCARTEAEMVGLLLGVEPLLGEYATKQAVLQAIHSVSLIHFAAHGNAERGEIALSPIRTTNSVPQEEDYLLMMSDISQVQLRAKLVVLSCCHSGRGKLRAEGVIGIARAFLRSGVRSVLVASWAIEDKAAEQLMSRFYEHLVGGESASESLHKAMKWLRSNGFSKPSQWAPFMLIGDNVTFDFKKQR